MQQKLIELDDAITLETGRSSRNIGRYTDYLFNKIK